MTNEELVSHIREGESEKLESLLLQNRGFIWKVAGKYRIRAEINRALDMDDLVQTASLGMIEAVPLWDESRGAFLTVAVLCMKKAIREALGIRSTKERIENMAPASLDAPIGEEDIFLADMIPDDSAVNPEQAAIQADTAQKVRQAVERLREPYRQSIKGRWFGEGEPDRGKEQTALSYLRKDIVIKELHEAAVYHHRGLSSFRTSHTSATEAAVLQREQYRKKGEKKWR